MINNKKKFYATILGNILDHYDIALYNFLAPFFSNLFFPSYDKISQLIIIYGVNVINIISRPLGSLLFGKMAINKSPQLALFISLIGMTLSTLIIGLLPSYQDIGVIAPILLILIKLIQGIFASGEDSISRLFILEGEKKEKLSIISSLYQSSGMFGVAIASIIAYLISASSNPEIYWRYGFMGAALTGIVALYIRVNLVGGKKDIVIKDFSFQDCIKTIRNNYRKMINFIFLAGLSYSTYALPCIFLVNFIPEISNIPKSLMYKINIYVIMIDLICLPIIGILSKKFDSKRILQRVSLAFLFSSPFMFLLLERYMNLYVIIGLILYFILLGLLFLVHLNVWFLNNVTSQDRYLIVGISNSIGFSLFGKTAPSICLYLWKETNLIYSPSFYVIFLSMSAYLSIFLIKQIQKT